MPQVSSDEVAYDVLTGRQQQPAYDPTAIYADSLREEKLQTILQQINPDNLLSDIENRIKGYKKDVLSQEWVKISESTPEVSDALVSNFMSFLGSVLNQNTSMSNFSGTEINAIMDNIIEYLGDDLAVNDRKYGLVGKYQEMTRIGNIITMTIFSVLKRAQNGMEARRVFSTLKIHESLTQAPDKKSFGDSLKFWK